MRHTILLNVGSVGINLAVFALGLAKRLNAWGPAWSIPSGLSNCLQVQWSLWIFPTNLLSLHVSLRAVRRSCHMAMFIPSASAMPVGLVTPSALSLVGFVLM